MNFTEKLNIPDDEFRLILGTTKIEYGDDKNDINIREKKYSLESAAYFFERLLLNTSKVPFITSDASTKYNEKRHMHMSIGDSGEVVFFVTTMRNEETIRIISFRKADKNERKVFFDVTGYSK